MVREVCHVFDGIVIRACLQNGFGEDLELIVVKTRREEGAYSLKSVTDEQQRLSRN